MKENFMADLSLYSEQDRQQMKISFISRSKSRLSELIAYARNSGFTRLGIAACRSMMPYAPLLKEILEKEGFEVFLVDCKESGLKNCEIFNDETNGPSCDPAAQADYLNRQNTQLNIDFGLCLGHGIIFSAKSKAPVTTFVVKDFAVNHSPLQELAETK